MTISVLKLNSLQSLSNKNAVRSLMMEHNGIQFWLLELVMI